MPSFQSTVTGCGLALRLLAAGLCVVVALLCPMSVMLSSHRRPLHGESIMESFRSSILSFGFPPTHLTSKFTSSLQQHPGRTSINSTSFQTIPLAPKFFLRVGKVHPARWVVIQNGYTTERGGRAGPYCRNQSY
jgi:hypothetical protein